MDKQMIEEMAKDMLEYGMEKYPTGESVFTETKLREQIYHVFLKYAEYLIKNGYCKIPKNAVVIDKDENPCLSCPVPEDIQRDVDCSTICGSVRLGIDWQNQCRVLVKENKQLTKELKQLRKETADKFAERLKENTVDEYDSEGVNHPYVILDYEELDEICKEFTETEK